MLNQILIWRSRTPPNKKIKKTTFGSPNFLKNPPSNHNITMARPCHSDISLCDTRPTLCAMQYIIAQQYTTRYALQVMRYTIRSYMLHAMRYTIKSQSPL